MANHQVHHPVHDANSSSPFGDLTRDEFYGKHGVRHGVLYVLNSRNMKLFTQTWTPEGAGGGGGRRLRGLVAMIHGYASETSWIFQLTAVAIAKLGFRVCAIDLPGHGYSDGPRGRMHDIDAVVEDCARYFDAARSGHEKLPAFLYGESLGGAIATLVHLRQKGQWSGLVLNGAMCGISPRFRPPLPVEKLLPAVALLAPDWRVSLPKPLAGRSYKEEWKRKLVANSPNKVAGKPPAATALEFLRVCSVIRRRCSEVDVPLLVVHGEDDTVCDAGSARWLVERAASKDKTLEIMPGMWHQLIGEPPENVEKVFGIIFRWLEEKTAGDRH